MSHWPRCAVLHCEDKIHFYLRGRTRRGNVTYCDPSLMVTVYLSVISLSLSLCLSLSGVFYQMSSFGESSAVKYSSRNTSTSFMMYNKRQLSRIYPSGRRVDSSNYNPVDMWNSGCQIGGCIPNTPSLSSSFTLSSLQPDVSTRSCIKTCLLRLVLTRNVFNKYPWHRFPEQHKHKCMY